MTPRSTIRIASLASCLMASLALAQVPNTCDLPRDIDKYQLLRRLSLDLRGQLPSYEEYSQLEAQPDVPTAMIEAWMQTEGFRQAMRRYHEELFWPNVTNVSLNNTNSQLTQKTGEPALSLTSASRRNLYRGDPDVSTTEGVQCGDFEQTHFTDAGTYVPDPAFVHQNAMALSDGGTKTVQQEGWRLVNPYWDPSTQVKVCAFDAVETQSTVIGGKTVGCDNYASNGRKECGCGPNLTYCYSGTVAKQITTAMREQLALSVDDVTVGGKPYTDLLLSTTMYENGALAQWRRTLANNLSFTRVYAIADPQEEIPAKPFTDQTWTKVDRGQLPTRQFHAGVLTLPAYLLRFQTNRARANRFRIDFECDYFVPPAQLTAQPGCQDGTTELTQRCYCQACHQTLEPLAAHWGQFAEAGTSMLTDTTAFPRKNPSCVNSSSSFCTRFYITPSDADNSGSLIPYQYADKTSSDPYRKAMGDNIEAGPRKLVNGIISDHTFARCTVKKLWGWFMKRDMHVLGAESEEAPVLDTLATGFEAHNYDLPWLIEQVVTQPQYRRVR
ncbi:MAG: hypothetical protein ACJ790_17430 [Myxococcaceae bacterium]